MIAEQAGGASTTGKRRVMGIRPESVHQRIPYAVGGQLEVRKYQESYGR
jgi:fructose-1,6-bisphosphatase I